MSQGVDGETFAANALISKEVVIRRFRLTLYANSVFAARASGGALKFNLPPARVACANRCDNRIAT
jgi:hypothetical protein